MTLDEWKKEQEKSRMVPHFNIRKPGEGEDPSQWKKTYILKKKEEESEEEVEEASLQFLYRVLGTFMVVYYVYSLQEDDEDYIRRGRAKHIVDIEINFSDSRRGRGRGRGGRGAPRGGISRGGFNSGRDAGGMGGGAGLGSGAGIGGGGIGSGGREGPRGNGGRFGNRSSKNQSAPKVDDENDFPSLVAA